MHGRTDGPVNPWEAGSTPGTDAGAARAWAGESRECFLQIAPFTLRRRRLARVTQESVWLPDLHSQPLRLSISASHSATQHKGLLCPSGRKGESGNME